MAHGGHVSAEGGWHAFLHLAAPLAFVVLTLAGAVALTGRVVRRRVDDGR